MILSFTDFSRFLLESGDIDPDYMFIREFSRRRKFSREKILEWLMLKVVVYNSVSELEYMLHKVSFDKLKFGAERNKSRRHAIEYFRNIKLVMSLNSVREMQYVDNPMTCVTDVKGFGAWAAWKFCDLLDCCMGLDVKLDKIDFREAYEFPLKGLLMVNDYEEDVKLLVKDVLYTNCLENVRKMLKPLNKVKSPHNNFRGIRINEVETLLCKYHSYMHGHYKPGQDIEHLINSIRKSPYPEINKFPSLW